MRQRGTPNSRKTYPTPKHLANPFHTLSTFCHIRFCPHIYSPCPSSCILKSFGRQLAHTRPPVLCPIVGLSLFNRVVTNAPIFLIRYTPSTTCSSSPAALLYINVPFSAVLCSQSCRSANFLLLLLMELRPSVITRHPECTNLGVSKVPCGSLLSEIDFLRAEGSIPFRTHNSESIRPYLPASNISINFIRHS